MDVILRRIFTALH